MSIHVCKCIHDGREEYHLWYPGMPKRAAQELADTINGSCFETDLARLHKKIAELKAQRDELLAALEKITWSQIGEVR